MCPDCADAARFRQAFNTAVEMFNTIRSTTPFPYVYTAAWMALYEAVRDHEGGLNVIKEIADLKSEVAKLTQELETCRSRTAEWSNTTATAAGSTNA